MSMFNISISIDMNNHNNVDYAEHFNNLINENQEQYPTATRRTAFNIMLLNLCEGESFLKKHLDKLIEASNEHDLDMCGYLQSTLSVGEQCFIEEFFETDVKEEKRELYDELDAMKESFNKNIDRDQQYYLNKINNNL